MYAVQTWSDNNPLYPGSAARFTHMEAGILGAEHSDWINVKQLGAIGDGITNDTAAIQNALNSQGTVYFPAGNYLISSALTVSSDTVIIGAGKKTIITQSSTTAHAFSGSAVSRLTIRDMYVQGPGSGSGDGLHLVKGANPATTYINLSNVTFASFGNDGVSIENPIVSALVNVVAVTNGRYGINLFGQVAGASGTSCALIGCYGNANTTAGYRIYNLTYSALNGCAADGNPIGYLIDSSQGIGVVGCGAEANVTNSFKITTCIGVTLGPVWVYNNKGVAVYVTGGSDAITLTAIDNSPNGTATNFIKVDVGSNSTLLSCKNVTANNVPSNSTTILPAGSGPTFGNYTTILASGEADGDWTTFGGDLIAGSAGRGLKVKEGTNAKMGLATLVAGTVTVSTTAVTASSRVFLTAQSTGGTAGALRISARTAGTSFVITSTSGTDTSTVAWMIVEPA